MGPECVPVAVDGTGGDGGGVGIQFIGTGAGAGSGTETGGRESRDGTGARGGTETGGRDGSEAGGGGREGTGGDCAELGLGLGGGVVAAFLTGCALALAGEGLGLGAAGSLDAGGRSEDGVWQPKLRVFLGGSEEPQARSAAMTPRETFTSRSASAREFSRSET
jgi:hypothetical protein